MLSPFVSPAHLASKLTHKPGLSAAAGPRLPPRWVVHQRPDPSLLLALGSPPCALLDGKAVVVSVCFPGLEILSRGVLWTHLHVHFLSSALSAQKVQAYLPTDLESLSTSQSRE